jgi:hypothetical protein
MIATRSFIAAAPLWAVRCMAMRVITAAKSPR